jgi:hypothetical protein
VGVFVSRYIAQLKPGHEVQSNEWITDSHSDHVGCRVLINVRSVEEIPQDAVTDRLLAQVELRC